MAILWISPAQAAMPASWKDTGFSINANGMTLRQVLKEFGLVYGVRVQINTPVDGALKGRLQASSGGEFLDRLALNHKFRWFVYADTLYVEPLDDNVSLRLEIGEDAVQDAKTALVGLGLFDNRFGWGELPDEGVVVVSGPRDYVNLAREILMPTSTSDGRKIISQGKQIMVFRLKYASATDREISTRGRRETIPGIKTILTALLNPDSSPSSSSERLIDGNNNDRFDVASEKRSRQGKLGVGSVRELMSGTQNGDANRNGSSNSTARSQSEEADSERKPKTRSTRDDRPRIEADPSLNAIVVYDKPSRREVYQNLIAELDIEPQQVEIEALIVDIDRSKLAEIGVEWNVGGKNTSATMNMTTADSKGADLPVSGTTLLIRNAAGFYARLKALEGNGEARVLAKPTVLTLENVAAVLDLSKSAYVTMVGERVADMSNITAGTLLKVVPRIVREGTRIRVRLDIDIEDGSLGDTTSLGNASGKTNVTRSTVSTQAIIDSQQTLMIGGYHSESKSTDVKKVPFLGDLPVVGGLFSNNSESISTRERLFLITPRLVGSTGTPARSFSTASLYSQATAIATNNNPAKGVSKDNSTSLSLQNVPEAVGMNLQISGDMDCGKECEK